MEPFSEVVRERLVSRLAATAEKEEPIERHTCTATVEFVPCS